MTSEVGARRLSWPGLAAGCGLGAIIFALFYPATSYDFLLWDGNGLILVMQKGSLFAGWDEQSEGQLFFYPIFLTWLLMIKELFGLNAGSFHWANILLHVVNTVCLFALVFRLSLHWMGAGRGAFWFGAVATALVWAVNPLRVEAVAWIAAGIYSLSTTLVLLAVILYLRPPSARLRDGLPFFTMYALAVASHPSVLLLFVVPLAIDWVGAKLTRKRLAMHTGLFLFALLVGLTQIYLRQKAFPETFKSDFSDLTGEAVKFIGYLGDFSILHGWWPSAIALVYPAFGAASIQGIGFWAGLLFLLAIPVAGALAGGLYLRLAVAWIACHLAFAIPLSGLGMAAYSPADRFLYLVSAFDALFLGVLINAILNRAGSRQWRATALIAAVALSMVVVYATQLKTELGYWRNTVTLMNRLVETSINREVELEAKIRITQFQSMFGMSEEMINTSLRRMIYIRNTSETDLLSAVQYAYHREGCDKARKLFSLTYSLVPAVQYQGAVIFLQTRCER